MSGFEVAFWGCLGLLVHTHLGYPLCLLALRALLPVARPPDPAAPGTPELPTVSLIIAAYEEEEVIAARVANALALDYPRRHLELIVASDGSHDRTVEFARRSGADIVVDLPRTGKIMTQNAAVRASSGEIVAFSDANAFWQPDALRRLVAGFVDPQVGYVCGQVRFASAGADNQEGAYWRYEMFLRRLESQLAGVTAGNGAIYAVRRDAYLFLEASRSHDLNFPFQLRRDGWRSRYAADAVASEKMVPTLGGEMARKRRMMIGLWDIVIRDGMLSPRRWGLLYGFQIYSHRILRYASPFLHLATFALNLALLGDGLIYTLILAAQLGLLGAAGLAHLVAARPLAIARYYVEVTGSIALGLWDRLRTGPPAAWEKSEGTR